MRENKFAEAESVLQRALKIQEKALGTSSPVLVATLGALEGLHYLNAEYPDAEPFYRRALQIQETAPGQGGPNLANNLGNLGSCFCDGGIFRSRATIVTRSNSGGVARA